jgi:hypothetical protein
MDVPNVTDVGDVNVTVTFLLDPIWICPLTLDENVLLPFVGLVCVSTSLKVSDTFWFVFPVCLTVAENTPNGADKSGTLSTIEACPANVISMTALPLLNSIVFVPVLPNVPLVL